MQGYSGCCALIIFELKRVVRKFESVNVHFVVKVVVKITKPSFAAGRCFKAL
jgi:hypothetical protein